MRASVILINGKDLSHIFDRGFDLSRDTEIKNLCGSYNVFQVKITQQ